MLILGIESSCDETAVAVVRDGRDVLADVIASQDDLHAEYGGVVPEIASRAHVQRIVPALRAALRDAGVTLDDIDAIAVANHPGLIGSLLVGAAAAKALAWALSKPIVGVDHVLAHLYACALGREAPALPALGLVVSGGHTSIYHVNSWLDIRPLGWTIDDAVGEAFDKVAAILGLAYPGGPKLDALASRGDDASHTFPVSLLEPGSLDFSFSGLKTAVLYTVKGRPVRREGKAVFPRDSADLSEQDKANIAASFQKAAVDALLAKLQRALEISADSGDAGAGGTAVGAGVGGTGVSPVYNSLLIGGGVSANSRLRAVLPQLAEAFDLELRLPTMRHCMDNAAMIAGLGWEKLRAGQPDDLTLQATPTAPRRP